MKHQFIDTDENNFPNIAVEFLANSIRETLAKNGKCILGLSGGSTPKPVYEALGKEEGIDWPDVYIFLVDDRYIAADDPDSNQYLVRNSLLLNADIPSDHIYFPDTSLSMEDCITAYTQSLIQLFAEQPADIMTLGLGSDGHIASLFPPVPEEAFGEILALHTTTNEFAIHDRISVSPLVIMSAQEHVLLLKGEDKLSVFHECAKSDIHPSRWPLHIALATERLVVIAQN